MSQNGYEIGNGFYWRRSVYRSVNLFTTALIVKHLFRLLCKIIGHILYMVNWAKVKYKNKEKGSAHEYMLSLLKR